MAGKEKIQNGELQGAVLSVRLTPRAKVNEIAGVLEDGTVKVRITAPPVEGKANEALLRFLAEALDLPVSRLKIVAGMTSRDKRVHVEGLERDRILQRMRAWGKAPSNR